MIKVIILILLFLFYRLILFLRERVTLNENIIKNVLKVKHYIPQKRYKIALCLSGRIQGLKECYKSFLNNFLNYYDVDIFMHCSIPSYEEKEFIINVIKPKKLIFNDLKGEINLYKLLNLQIYRIYKCNFIKNEYMVKENIKYDFVIKSRPDLIFQNILNLDNIEKGNTLYNPVHIKNWNSSNIYSLGIGDQIFISSNEIMDICCNFFLHKNNYKDITCMVPEIKFGKYIKDNNVNVKFFNFNWIIYQYLTSSSRGFLEPSYLKKIPYMLNKTCYVNVI